MAIMTEVRGWNTHTFWEGSWLHGQCIAMYHRQFTLHGRQKIYQENKGGKGSQ